MLKRAAQRRFVAWLAFAAMALIVLMPAISRSMSMSTDMDMSGMVMDADHPMDMAHADHRHSSMPGDPSDPTARCAYCVLLSHSPVTGLAFAPIVLAVDLPALEPQAIAHRVAPFAPLLSAHPRGPPLRFNG